MSELVELAQAKARTRIDFADDDEDAQAILDEAEEHVVAYLKGGDDADWTDNRRVQAAILLVFGEIYEKREAADLGSLFAPPAPGSPGGSCFNLLNQLRDPALA